MYGLRKSQGGSPSHERRDADNQLVGIVMPRLHVVVLVLMGLTAGGYSALSQDAVQPPVLPIMVAPLEKSRIAIAECRERRLKRNWPPTKRRPTVQSQDLRRLAGSELSAYGLDHCMVRCPRGGFGES